MTIRPGHGRRLTQAGGSRRFAWGLLWAAPVLVMIGCGSPSKVNIELRRQNAELRDQVGQLERKLADQRLTIQTLESERPTVPILPGERLEELFLVSDLLLGRLSGGGDTDPDTPGDEVLRVVAAPADAEGDTIKAAGRFVIELFELDDQPRRIGHWELEPDQTRHRWIDSGLVYGYLFELPWQQPPTTDRLILRVQFEDALTQRRIQAERIVEVNPPQPQ